MLALTYLRGESNPPTMQLVLFQILSALNRSLLPCFSKRPDLTRLKKWEQVLVGWKMWVTYRYLDAKNQR